MTVLVFQVETVIALQMHAQNLTSQFLFLVSAENKC